MFAIILQFSGCSFLPLFFLDFKPHHINPQCQLLTTQKTLKLPATAGGLCHEYPRGGTPKIAEFSSWRPWLDADFFVFFGTAIWQRFDKSWFVQLGVWLEVKGRRQKFSWPLGQAMSILYSLKSSSIPSLESCLRCVSMETYGLLKIYPKDQVMINFMKLPRWRRF